MAGTPEGFKWFYQRYVKEFNSETDLLVRASTYDNKHLPEQYISNLEQQYPPNLLKAYLNGEFVNLTSGSVYNEYDVDNNNTDRVVEEKDHTIHIGMDFNITKMSAVVHVLDSNTPYAVDELVNVYDTFQMILMEWLII